METKPAIVNALSVDVEEYFHAKVFQEGTGGAIGGLESRVEASTERVLALLATTGVKATFFVLGEVAAAHPEYFSALSEIDVLPGGGFGMMDSLFRRPIRVLRRDASEKIRALLAARSLIETRGWEARAIDLRFADRIVLVGAYGAGSSL